MGDFFKFNTPGESPGFLLWKVNNLWQREIKKVLRKYDLTHTQFVVLASTFWLSGKNEDITQTAIANFVGIDKMMTSSVIRKLIDKKMLFREQHRADTRAKVITITPEGKDVLKKAVEEVENFDTGFFGPLMSTNAFNEELQRLLKDNNG